MLIAFMSFRIMLQTDLIMLAPLGEFAKAAFGVPMRIMWIDTIVALSLIPVVSVHIASIHNDKDKSRAISGILGAAFFLSIILVLIGLFLYPLLINYFVKDPIVAKLSWEAVFWLTISIPVRLILSLTQMLLFSTRKGQLVNVINVVALSINVFLNWIFIYRFNMGFKGAYVSTVLVSSIELAWVLFLIRSHLTTFQVFKSCFNEFKKIMGMLNAEFIRLFAWTLMWFASLALFASYLSDTDRLAAYSVFIEFYFLINMALVALMRSISIVLAQEKITIMEKYQYISKLTYKGLAVTALVMVILWIFCTPIGMIFYKLEDVSLEWWKAGIQIFAINLILCYWNAIQKGIWQSCKEFKMIAILEVIVYWSVFIPGIYLGLKYNNPYLTWVGSVLAELFIGLYLWFYRPFYLCHTEIQLASEGQ